MSEVAKSYIGWSEERIERFRARYRVENMTPEQLEKRRARDRVENMTPEQLEKKRARDRIENMTPEQVEKTRARDRIENMTPEQLEKKRARDRERSNTATCSDPIFLKVGKMLKDARKRRSHDFGLTRADIEPLTVCPYLGIEIDWRSSGGTAPNSPTLDRICGEWGYIPGNVVVCSQAGNSMKSELDSLDHARLAARDFKIEKRLIELYGKEPGGFIDPGRRSLGDDGQPFCAQRRRRIRDAKGRAKRGDYPFSLTLEDVPFVERCELSGVLLDWENGMAPNGATIDKVVPARGYVPENVRVVAWCVNVAMQNAAPKQRAKLAVFIEKTRAKLLATVGRNPISPPVKRVIGNGTGEDV